MSSQSQQMSAAKVLLRKEMKKRIGRILSEVPHVVSEETFLVHQKLLDHPWLLSAKRISIFVGTVGEIQTDELIRWALKEGKQVFIPRFRRGKERMEMLRVDSEMDFDELDVSLWGIRQHPTNSQRLSFSDGLEAGQEPLDVVVMPGLAFTTEGKRLGHGRGYYDRFLNEYERAHGKVPRTIGLALRAQLLDDLPMDKWDRRVDLLLHA